MIYVDNSVFYETQWNDVLNRFCIKLSSREVLRLDEVRGKIGTKKALSLVDRYIMTDVDFYGIYEELVLKGFLDLADVPDRYVTHLLRKKVKTCHAA